MPELTLQHKLAAAACVARLEEIVALGVLNEDLEAKCRLLIVKTCQTFKHDTIAERPLEGAA